MSNISNWNSEVNAYQQRLESYQQQQELLKSAFSGKEDAIKKMVNESLAPVAAHFLHAGLKSIGTKIKAKAGQYYNDKIEPAIDDLTEKAQDAIGNVKQTLLGGEELISDSAGKAQSLVSQANRSLNTLEEFSGRFAADARGVIESPVNFADRSGLSRPLAFESAEFKNPLFDPSELEDTRMMSPFETTQASAVDYGPYESRFIDSAVEDNVRLSFGGDYTFAQRLGRPAQVLPSIQERVAGSVPKPSEVSEMAVDQSRFQSAQDVFETDEQSIARVTEQSLSSVAGDITEGLTSVTKGAEVGEIAGDVAEGLEAAEGVSLAASAETGGLSDILFAGLAVGGILANAFGHHEEQPPTVSIPNISLPSVQRGLSA